MPLSLRDEIAASEPTANLHDVIKHHQDERVDLEVEDAGVNRDVDTRADLEVEALTCLARGSVGGLDDDLAAHFGEVERAVVLEGPRLHERVGVRIAEGR